MMLWTRIFTLLRLSRYHVCTDELPGILFQRRSVRDCGDRTLLSSLKDIKMPPDCYMLLRQRSLRDGWCSRPQPPCVTSDRSSRVRTRLLSKNFTRCNPLATRVSPASKLA